MKGRIFLLFFWCCLILAPTGQAHDERATAIWEKVLAQEEQPLNFVQTVITVFPKRTAITVDYVTRISPSTWFLQRKSDEHGPLIFYSHTGGFWALAAEEALGLHDPRPRALQEILHPTLHGDSRNLRFLEETSWRGRQALALERAAKGQGSFRYWIDAQQHYLLKEESLDEQGRLIYILLREKFASPDQGEDWWEEPPRVKYLPNEREWWQEVLLARLQKHKPPPLLPRGLPAKTYLVAALQEADGSTTLRYFDGQKVFSIFQKKGGATGDSYLKSGPYAVFTTSRQGMLITIVGPLQRQEMEAIADSLQIFSKGDFHDWKIEH